MTTWAKQPTITPSSSWVKETLISSSSWKEELGPVIDLGAGLDELLNRMTDEADNVIIFHTGDFYEQNTSWTIII